MKIKNYILQPLRIAILALAVIPLGVLQTAAAEDAAPEGENAVMCDKCKTVWVNRPITVGGAGGGKGGGVVTYRKKKVMKCEECENAVVTFFKTGKLQHECKSCASELTHCKAD